MPATRRLSCARGRLPRTPPIAASNSVSASSWRMIREPRCTERSPYRELAVTRGALRKQQIGHVHAGDREEQDDGAGDRYQCGSDASRELVLQRVGNEAVLKRGPSRPRILRPASFGQSRPAPVAALADRRISSHATHEAQMMAPFPAVERKCRVCTSAATRSPPIGPRTFSKPPGMTPITVTGMSLNLIWRPMIVGSALKRRRHSAIADDDDERAVGRIVGRLEVSSERRPHAQHAEVVRADVLTVEPLRFARRRSSVSCTGRMTAIDSNERLRCDELAIRAERHSRGAIRPGRPRSSSAGRASG